MVIVGFIHPQHERFVKDRLLRSKGRKLGLQPAERHRFVVHCAITCQAPQENVVEPGRQDAQLFVSGKGYQLRLVSPQGCHRCAARDDHSMQLRCREVKGQRGDGGHGRLKLDAQQLQQFDIVFLGHLIQTVEQQVDHPGK